MLVLSERERDLFPSSSASGDVIAFHMKETQIGASSPQQSPITLQW